MPREEITAETLLNPDALSAVVAGLSPESQIDFLTRQMAYTQHAIQRLMDLNEALITSVVSLHDLVDNQ